MLTTTAVHRFIPSAIYAYKYFLAILVLFCVNGPSYADNIAKSFPEYQLEEVATGLNFPWSLAFMPNGELLVTEHSGQLRIVSNGKVSEAVKGLPEDIYIKSQGGPFDVVLHPEYPKNGWIYLSYAVGNDDRNTLRLLRGKLTEQELVQ